MDDFTTVFGPARLLGTEQILAGLLLTFILCSAWATVYRWTFQGLSYSRTFVHTLVLGGMITALVIMAIGNNLARGLGILGTLALIRFRTQVRDSRDMMFIFASLGVGIACGANVFNVAILGTLVLSAAALLLHWSPFATRREHEGLLRFMLPPKSPHEAAIRRVLETCCMACHLVAMREAAQGDLIEYSYQVRLADPSYQKDLVQGLREVEGVQEPCLLMQRTTVEL
jgi:uncharacterized membrane protein YhiD involved in acid resistance